jgi:phospholipase C
MLRPLSFLAILCAFGACDAQQLLPDAADAPDLADVSGAETDLANNPDLASAQHIKTVFVIVMENHSWATLKGNASAPYINGTLIPMAARAEAYRTPTQNHPSEPNYIWLEAGDALGITNDNPPSANHQATKDHLVSQLDGKGISWRSYQEGITDGTCPLTASGLYDPKHNPMLYFDDVTDTNSATSAKCIAHMSSFTALDHDLSAGTVARYNFITPNLCDDMHGQVVGLQCQLLIADMVKLGDTFLSQMVPKILASPAYLDHGALFITWDEGDEKLGQTASDGPIGMLVISPLGKGGGYANTVPYTHSSMLRTVETIFGVPYLRAATSATDLSDLFVSFP